MSSSSLGHNFAATRARARPKIDNVVGSPDRFFIVLDHDDGIAEIAQSRSVPSSAHYRAGADRCWARRECKARPPDRSRSASPAGSLRFAPGKRAALAIECEITEPDLEEKLQARRISRTTSVTIVRCAQPNRAPTNRSGFNRLFTELMDVQFPRRSSDP